MGYKGVQEGFNEYPKLAGQTMTAFGKADPAKVLIIGTGVGGLKAIGSAKALGAIVKATDIRDAAREQAESFGAEYLYPTEYIGVEFKGEGGYAGMPPPEFFKAQEKMLVAEAPNVDIVICTALIPGRPAPVSISKDFLKALKPGSVIVDLAAERGGNCYLTKDHKGEKHVDPETGVILLAYTDWCSRMAPQASEFWANNMFNLFTELKDPKAKKEVKIADAYKLNYEEQMVNGLTFVKDGARFNDKKRFPDPEKKKDPKDTKTHEVEAKIPPYLWSLFIAFPVIIIAILIGLATNNNYQLLFNIFVFTLACIIGYMVIWGVTSALHTPLMSVTNAISGIIIIGCMLQLTSNPFFVDYSICGFIGAFFASINVFGGFIVTQKMINMFVADSSEPEKKHHH